MDEKSFLEVRQREMRSRNQQKFVSRMCCVSRIKPEYQSSVMALKNKVQLWDPTGRLYVLLRGDKLLSVLNAEMVNLRKGDLVNGLTGALLVYPSMLFVVLEFPSESALHLTTFLSANMGVPESYVQQPILISEAHGVERMYNRITSVLLNIPGPMEMDMDRMRAEWRVSFKNVMTKVYRLGRALTSSSEEARKSTRTSQWKLEPDLSSADENGSRSTNKDKGSQVTLAVKGSPFTKSNLTPKGSQLLNHSAKGSRVSRVKGANSQVDLANNWNRGKLNFYDDDDDDQDDKQESKRLTGQSFKSVSFKRESEPRSSEPRSSAGTDEAETKRKERIDRAVRRVSMDSHRLDETMMNLCAMNHLNTSSNFVSSTIATKHEDYLHVASPEPRHVGTAASDIRVREFIKAKRLTLAHGDPMLQFIPPQRDLVLILHCDKFQPMSRSVKLHTQFAHDAGGREWPREPEQVRFPLQKIRSDS